nr:hypothetical protein [Pseudonocardiales bacterium]
ALRGRGSATSSELGEAMALTAGEVRDGLRALVAEGLVHRSGHARGTRYHA